MVWVSYMNSCSTVPQCSSCRFICIYLDPCFTVLSTVFFWRVFSSLMGHIVAMVFLMVKLCCCSHGVGESVGVISLVMSGRSSLYVLISLLDRCTKLLLFNLPLARYLNLAFIGCVGIFLYFSACMRVFVSRLYDRDGVHVIFSIASIGVVFIAPVINRRAWFCTLSRA